MATTDNTTAVASGIADVCLPVQVFVVDSFWDADKLSVAIAFIVGLIIGILVALLCAKLCMRDISNSKDGQHYRILEEGTLVRTKDQGMMLQQKSFKESSSSKRRSTKKKKKMLNHLHQRQTRQEEEAFAPIALINIEPTKTATEAEPRGDTTGCDGLVEVLLQPTTAGTEEELSKQDMDALEELDGDMTEGNIMTMMQMMRTLLGQQLAMGNLSKDDVSALVKGTQTSVNTALSTAQDTRDNELQALNSKKFKDPSEKDAERDKIQSAYLHKLIAILPDERNKLRRELSSKTQLSEKEIDALMGELSDNMAALESQLGAERTKQAKTLEERLLQRRLAREMQNAEESSRSGELTMRADAKHELLQGLVHDGKLIDRQKDEILETYRNDLQKLQMKTNEEIQRQQLSAAKKLRSRRDERNRKLAEEEETQKEEFLRQADKFTDAAAVMKAYNSLLQSQRAKRNEITDEMDDDEAKVFADITKEQQHLLDKEVSVLEDSMQDAIRKKAQLSDSEARNLMQLYENQMKDVQKMKKSQRKQQMMEIEEKIAQRRLKADEERQTLIAEQQTLKQSQDAMIQKVLTSQLELTDDAKNEILREHEHNVATINNQLQMTKLRQQKILQQKLNKRQAKVADLKMKANEMKTASTQMKPKEREKLQQQLETQIQIEEKNLANEMQVAEAELRERVAKETELALSEQEKNISLLMARLQVGQARRQAIIQKQDKTIKELEEQLANRVSSETDGHSDAQVNMILKHHYDQMNNLNEQITDTRERQQQMFAEKLNVKKLQKERELEQKLEAEAQVEWKEQKKRGAGLATSILSQTFLEQRHQMALRQLERDMQSEMQSQREELNRELETELQHELKNQKKTFLAQLAAISNMSKQELDQLIGNAVVDTGGNEKDAKKLSKELRLEMNRAKSNMGLDDSPPRNPHYGDGDDGFNEQTRPQSSKRQSSRPRSGFGQDEDDF